LLAFLDLTHLFSFLTSNHLSEVHKQINFLVKQVGYSYIDIMYMPIFSRLLFIDDMSKSIEKAKKKK